MFKIPSELENAKTIPSDLNMDSNDTAVCSCVNF